MSRFWIDYDVKIQSLAIAEAKYKHFHNIDYVIEVESLYPKRTFSFGALTNVKWYSDEALTDEIVNVDIEYGYDSLGFSTGRTVTRKWMKHNETYHPDEKITTKDYTINPQDQLDEAILRRTNNVRQTNLMLIGIVPGLTQADPYVLDKTMEEIRDDGVAFYEEHSGDMTVYIETGGQNLENAVRDSITGNWGTPVIGWFNTDASTIGINGVSDIRDFIIYQLSNGVRNKNGVI